MSRQKAVFTVFVAIFAAFLLVTLVQAAPVKSVDTGMQTLCDGNCPGCPTPCPSKACDGNCPGCPTPCPSKACDGNCPGCPTPCPSKACDGNCPGCPTPCPSKAPGQ